MIELKKIDSSNFQLIGSNNTLTLNKEQYEDLFYAVPPESGKYLNSTAFYRLFTDSLFTDDNSRTVFLEMLKEGDNQEAVLNSLQDQIKKIEP
jgi:hypothetical protein